MDMLKREEVPCRSKNPTRRHPVLKGSKGSRCLAFTHQLTMGVLVLILQVLRRTTVCLS